MLCLYKKVDYGVTHLQTKGYILCGTERTKNMEMKRKYCLAVLTFMAVCTGVICSCSKDDSVVNPGNGGGRSNNHEYVDLGLPNGTLWATCNVGANSPEEYGDYFAWGETQPKSVYESHTYKYYNGGKRTKYNKEDGRTELDTKDDAATVNWGKDWQTPSKTQIYDLTCGSYTTIEWTTLNGVSGTKITSKSNGNSIFLPAAGHSRHNPGELGRYWSRSLAYSLYGDVYYLEIDILGPSIHYAKLWYGYTIRPVRKQ